MLSHESYYERPVAKNVATSILQKDGGWYLLEHALLFPGGGGQDSDKGTVNGVEVKGLDKRADGVWHDVPGLDLNVGEEVEVVLDWGRRYRLMSAHTGEHLLFSGLKIVEPALVNRKVSFQDGHYSLFLEGPLDALVVEKALIFANTAIRAGAKVCRDVYPFDKAKTLDGVRGDWENFDPKADISVVSIEEIDSCACGGVHLEDISELGLLAVKRIIKSQDADWQLDFVFGEDAFILAAADNRLVLELRDLFKIPRDTMLSTITNLRSENKLLKDGVNTVVKSLLGLLEAEDLNGLKFVSYGFSGANQKVLNQFASAMTKEGGKVILLGNRSKKLSVILSASPDSGVDCKKIMEPIILKHKGNGGGKPQYFQAGFDPEADWEDIVSMVKQGIGT